MTKFAKEKPNDCRGCKHRKDCGGNLKECYYILPEEQVSETAPSAYPCNGCPYGKNHEICFPCYKDLLGQEGIKAWKKSH